MQSFDEKFFQRTAKSEAEALTFTGEAGYNIDSCSRGGSGTLYPQSAIVGVILHGGLYFVRLPSESGVDVRVLRDRNP